MSNVNRSALILFALNLQFTHPEFRHETLTYLSTTPEFSTVLASPSLQPYILDLYHSAVGPNTTAEQFAHIMQYDLPHNNIVWPIYGLFFGMTSITTTLVFVRIYTRWRLLRTIWPSDWLVLAGTTLMLGFCMMTMPIGLVYGAGHHQWDVSYHNFSINLKYTYVCGILYYLNLLPTKLAFLCFYWTLLSSRNYRITLLVLGVIMTVSTIAYFFANVFLCHPLQFWNDTLHKRCINRLEVWESMSAMSMLTDFAILVLPIPVIIKLNLSTRDKISVFALLALGGIGVITSAIRFVFQPAYANNFNTEDFTWIQVKIATLTVLESQIALMCASAPALKAFVKQIMPTMFKGNTTMSLVESDGLPRWPVKHLRKSGNFDSTLASYSTVIGESGGRSRIMSIDEFEMARVRELRLDDAERAMDEMNRQHENVVEFEIPTRPARVFGHDR